MTHSIKEFIEQHRAIREELALLKSKTDEVYISLEELKNQIATELSYDHLLDAELIIAEKESISYDEYVLESLDILKKGFFPRYCFLTNNLNKNRVGKKAKVFKVQFLGIETKQGSQLPQDIKGDYFVWKIFANPIKNDGTYGNLVITTQVFDKAF